MTASTKGTVSPPAKIVLERRVRPGRQHAFATWVRELVEAAQRSQALEGSSVLASGSGEHIILLRFATQDDLDRWHTAPETIALLHAGEALATASESPVVRTGLETWFTLPGVPTPRSAPPKWKMALVTWLALMPQVIVLGFVVPHALPLLLRVALSTAIPVAMLTWVVMPRLTRLLYSWLYR